MNIYLLFTQLMLEFPQGSILGSTLILLYTNDLLEDLGGHSIVQSRSIQSPAVYIVFKLFMEINWIRSKSGF